MYQSSIVRNLFFGKFSLMIDKKTSYYLKFHIDKLENILRMNIALDGRYSEEAMDNFEKIGYSMEELLVI